MKKFFLTSHVACFSIIKPDVEIALDKMTTTYTRSKMVGVVTMRAEKQELVSLLSGFEVQVETAKEFRDRNKAFANSLT